MTTWSSLSCHWMGVSGCLKLKLLRSAALDCIGLLFFALSEIDSEMMNLLLKWLEATCHGLLTGLRWIIWRDKI